MPPAIPTHTSKVAGTLSAQPATNHFKGLISL
jgi:hypothetical protein